MDMISIRSGQYHWQSFDLAMDFVIAENSITAVVGPSGAGKSTLLNIIAGFEHLTSGTLVLAGIDHTKTPPAQRPVSLVFQDNNTFAHLTARDNVAIGVSPKLRLTKAEAQAVDTALQKTGLQHLAAVRPGEMSGGERQRIALARVLVRKRPILLLDEAFAALGPALRNDMLQLVKLLQQELSLTVLMVTHQPEDAKAIADSIMFVDGSRVHAAQSVAGFFASRDKSVRAYLD
jgi:thiamine transport system ATP-binding protein